jgi:hypothetical protein
VSAVRERQLALAALEAEIKPRNPGGAGWIVKLHADAIDLADAVLRHDGTAALKAAMVKRDFGATNRAR